MGHGVDFFFVVSHFVAALDALFGVVEDFGAEHFGDGADHVIRVPVGDEEEVGRFVVVVLGDVGLVDEGDLAFGLGHDVADEDFGVGAYGCA